MQIAIIGKPNVGKSTLFNRLCGKKLAIIEDSPGVTRDRKKYPAKLFDLKFTLIDTAGWEIDKDILKQAMASQTKNALLEADLIWFMIDGMNGISAADLEVLKIIRISGRPLMLIVNKSEGKLRLNGDEIYKAGLDDPVYIAANTGMGMDSLYNHTKTMIEKHNISTEEIDIKEDPNSIKVAIIGRPNVGKSTLFNSMLGFERVVTSEISGTTRDSITHKLNFQDQVIEIIDTAGMRKKGKIISKIEDMSVGEAINAIRRANMVILVIDATETIMTQDLSIAQIAINEGKALLLVVNKSDLVEKRGALAQEITHQLENKLRDLHGVNIIYTSAIRNKNVQEVMEKMLQIHKVWAKKVATGPLNKWLENATSAHIPPLAQNGRRIRLKYIVQNAVKPPTFSIFANIPEDLPDSYTKYLTNSMRNALGLHGVPIRIKYKKNHNPYKS